MLQPRGPSDRGEAFRNRDGDLRHQLLSPLGAVYVLLTAGSTAHRPRGCTGSEAVGAQHLSRRPSRTWKANRAQERRAGARREGGRCGKPRRRNEKPRWAGG